MSRRGAQDDFLYEADAVEVGILLFGPHRCRECGHKLPKNTDYFAPDRANPSGLVYECRRCRRQLERRRYLDRRAEEVVGSGQLSILQAAAL